VADAARKKLGMTPKKWRRRDETNRASCRIGNIKGTGPTLVKPKKSAKRTAPQSVEVRVNTAHNSWRRFLQRQVTIFFLSFCEKDTDFP
jgi:hypothetical protein